MCLAKNALVSRVLRTYHTHIALTASDVGITLALPVDWVAGKVRAAADITHTWLTAKRVGAVQVEETRATRVTSPTDNILSAVTLAVCLISSEKTKKKAQQ